MHLHARIFISSLLLFSALAVPAVAQPNVDILDIQPRQFGAAQAFPLAAPSSTGDRSFEISLDAQIRNNEPDAVSISGADLVFGAGFTPSTASLFNNLMMQCGGGSVTAVTTSAVIQPGQTCRLLLTDDPRLTPWVPEWVTLNLFFNGEDQKPVTETFQTVVYANDQPRGGFLFPASVDDLAEGEFWSTRSTGIANSHRQSARQMFSYDAGVVRWDDATSAWVDRHPLSDGETNNGDENQDWLVWGKPIYAMADGVVVSCTDGIADNVPGVRGNTSNSFVIDHGDERASYLHLMQNTTNGAICFAGANVQAGDFLGLAGNSGWSTAPHLHIHIDRSGQGFPLLFRDTFIVERDGFTDPQGNADWQYVDGLGMPWEVLAIWPSPLRRRDRLVVAPGSDLEILDLSSDTVVTAMKDAGGNLDVRTFGRIGNGDLVDLEVDGGGGFKQVAMAKPSVTTDFVTAVRTNTDNLKMIAWNSNLDRDSSWTAGPVTDVAITPSPHLPGVVTATRSSAGNLEVIGWDVSPWNDLQKGGKDQGVAVSDVAIATGSNFAGVVTASRSSGGKLVIDSWEVAENEVLVDWRDQWVGGDITDVEIAYLRTLPGRDRLVTAARTAAGNLLVTAWDVYADGSILEVSQAGAGPVSDFSISDGGDFHVLTAVRTASGDFKLIGWEIAVDGTISRHGEAPGGAISEVALGKAMFVNPTNRRQAVTAVRDSNGDLRLTSWEVALEPGP
ncbi:MAG: M23 family metallopeptidase [Acidobacteriota bacterium]